MTVEIIAFCGKKGHGKTTAARSLELIGYKRYSLAAPIKNFFHKLFGVTENQYIKDSSHMELHHEEYGQMGNNPLVRVLMQQAGDFAKEGDDDHFSRLCLDLIVGGNDRRIVIDDLRFPEEAEYFYDQLHQMRDGPRSYQLTIVKIFRPGFVSDDQHTSETSCDLIKEDILIENTGDIMDFLQIVYKALRKVIE